MHHFSLLIVSSIFLYINIELFLLYNKINLAYNNNSTDIKSNVSK